MFGEINLEKEEGGLIWAAFLYFGTTLWHMLRN
jgi:hypothetical protein